MPRPVAIDWTNDKHQLGGSHNIVVVLTTFHIDPLCSRLSASYLHTPMRLKNGDNQIASLKNHITVRQERIRQSVIGDPETIDCPVREQTREQPFKDLCHVSSVMKQRYSRQWALGHRLLSMRQPQKSGPTENHILMAIISPHPPPSCSQPQELVFISPTQASSKPPLQASERTTNQPLLQYVVILGLSHIGETAAPFYIL
jgi:hypothetical protein